MRYSIFVRGFMRPELFRSSEFIEALSLADQLGGEAYVFDWWRFQRLELDRPCIDVHSRAKGLRVAAGT